MGVQGMTIVVASGDNGMTEHFVSLAPTVTSWLSSGAAGPNNIYCDSDIYPPFNPLFPASSTYVVSVGGTMIRNSTRLPSPGAPPICQDNFCIGGGEEVACSGPTSEITSGRHSFGFLQQPERLQSWQHVPQVVASPTSRPCQVSNSPLSQVGSLRPKLVFFPDSTTRYGIFMKLCHENV